jgi:hypothetical protein
MVQFPRRFSDTTFAELSAVHLLELFRSSAKILLTRADKALMALVPICDAKQVRGHQREVALTGLFACLLA